MEEIIKIMPYVVTMLTLCFSGAYLVIHFAFKERKEPTITKKHKQFFNLK